MCVCTSHMLRLCYAYLLRMYFVYASYVLRVCFAYASFMLCIFASHVLRLCFACTSFMQGRRGNCAFPPIARGINRSLSNR